MSAAALVIAMTLAFLAGAACTVLIIWLCFDLNAQPPQPGPINAILKEEPMAGVLVYDVQLPPLAEADVSLRKLTVKVGDVSEEFELENERTSFEIKVPQGSDVSLSLVNIDDAGNVSPASEQSFLAQDTIPPDAPGAFGSITLVREE